MTSFHFPPTLALALVSAAVIPSTAQAKKAGDPVPDVYLCLLAPGPISVTAEAEQAARLSGGRVLHTYTRTFNGFALRAPAAAIARVT